MTYCYNTGKIINQFEICYMINPSLKFNNALITHVEKCLGDSFSFRTMKTIKYILMKKNTSVMTLIMINENNGEIPETVYRVLSCVVYNTINNYVFIDHL